MSRHRSSRVARALGAAAGILRFALAGVPAGAQPTNAQGVSKNSVKLGFIWSGTGVAAPNFQDSADACNARVDAQNAKGPERQG